MTIKALYPTTRPTLDLNFAATKRLDPRITYSRASTGTFVGSNGLIQTAAVNQARFEHNPLTGESLGLLVERAKTNLVQYSQEFDNGYYDTNTGVSVVANTVTAPDGTLTADLLREDASTGTHQRLRYGIYSMAAGQYYTSSAFVKPAGRTVVTFEYRDNINTIFNLSTLTVSGAGSGNATLVASSITPFPNGWYRLTATSFGAGPYNSGFGIGLMDGANRSYTGDSTSGAYVWGLQVENAAFPTSYIPTTGATVTRAGDVADITGANFSSWFNSSAGTVSVSTKTLGPLPTASALGAWSINDNTTNNELSLLNLQPYYRVLIKSGNLVVAGNWLNSTTFSSITTGVSYDTTGASWNYNGTTPNNFSTAGAFLATQLELGNEAQNRRGSTCIKRFTYWPVRLPDAQLQALTAT